MKVNNIQNLLVKPKRQNKFVYFINENLDNGHYANSDDVYKLIASLTTEEVSNRALKNIREYKMFFIDVNNQICYEVSIDQNISRKQLKESIFCPSNEEIMQQVKLDNSNNTWYINFEGILSKFSKDTYGKT
jgi:hypothetical protein